MRYTILGFNQKLVLDNCLSLNDILLLDYIRCANGEPTMKHIIQDEVSYVWLDHKKIKEDLPILNYTEGTLRNKLSELKQKGLITSICVANKNAKGSMTYYSITEKTMSFINDTRCNLKMTSNNSISNINNNVVSKDTTYMQQPEFEFGKPNKKSTKKKTNEDEYLDSVLLIDNFTDDNELKKLLKELFRNKCNECSSKRFHYSATTCKNYLSELEQVDDKIGAVRLSIRYNNTMKVMQPSTSPGINNVFSESEGMRKNQRKADKKDLATDEDGNYIVY